MAHEVPAKSVYDDRARPAGLAAAEAVFSVDVEDWFHILDVPSSPPLETWSSLPSCVEANFHEMLDLFSEKEARVTCFFLGWVAERFPGLVKEALRRGHEVASHGYAHRLVFEQSRREFLEDVVRARKLLEDISGVEVLGYRSPGFSVTGWFFDALGEAGYSYDSSVFPAPRGHGGMRTGQRGPHWIGSKPILEFPITIVDLFHRPICCTGGGYLRLFPYWLIRRLSRRVLPENRPLVFYIHPREIDAAHPRLPMSAPRRFKSYYNLGSTKPKMNHILGDFRLKTFRDLLPQKSKAMEA